MARVRARWAAHHGAPQPSSTPEPVRATFSALKAERQGLGRWEMRPSYWHSCKGKAAGSFKKRMTAPGSRCSSILLQSSMGPVEYSPVGTVSTPPPALCSSAMAWAKQSVQTASAVLGRNWVKVIFMVCSFILTGHRYRKRGGGNRPAPFPLYLEGLENGKVMRWRSFLPTPVQRSGSRPVPCTRPCLLPG